MYCEAAWLELGAIILSKMIEKQKITYHIFSLINGSYIMGMHGHKEWSNGVRVRWVRAEKLPTGSTYTNSLLHNIFM